MNRFTLPSFAKINLALQVLGRRADGYHELRTVFQSIDLHDTIEFETADRLELACEDLTELPPGQNLVWKAAQALSRACPGCRGARLTLRKCIPLGAGLGGGSGNAATTLLGLRRLWNAPVSDAELTAIGASLGSDVPFFLTGGVALGIGRGDEIYPLPDLPAMPLAVVFPGVRVSTGEAYQILAPLLTSPRSPHKIQCFCGQMRDGTSWLAGMFNDFETSILPAYPAIREARRFLERHGATAILLSGSGSSVFGFFESEESARAALRENTRDDWRVFPAKTLSRSEYLRRILG